MADTRTLVPETPDLGVSGIATSVWDLIRGVQGKSIDESRAAAAAADPFAQQRGGYQTDLRTTMDNPANSYMAKLTELLTNPGSFVTDPGYQFARDQGLDAVARKGNAMFGTTRSGNTAVELERFATGFAEQAFDTRVQQLLAGAGQEQQNYNQRINALLTASGATTGSPGTAGALLSGGFANRNQDIAGGARGIDQLLRLIAGGGKAAAGAVNTLKQIFSDSGIDDPNIDLSGSNEDFLRSIGFDPTIYAMDSPFGPDPGIMDDITNVIDMPGDPLANLDLGNVSDSTANIIGDLGPDIFEP